MLTATQIGTVILCIMALIELWCYYKRTRIASTLIPAASILINIALFNAYLLTYTLGLRSSCPTFTALWSAFTRLHVAASLLVWVVLLHHKQKTRGQQLNG